MAILRAVDADIIEPLMESIISTGLETVEITMNTANAVELIRKAKSFCADKLMLGAGTVLSLDSLKRAVEAGAGFIVSPVVVEPVVEYCVKNKIPVFAGAFTPQEIYKAWCLGATMVKVFPVKFAGPQYLKDIKGPFNDIELLACSGVSPENLKDYFSCGASAAAFGSSVFTKEWLSKGDFQSIKQRIKRYIDAYFRVQ